MIISMSFHALNKRKITYGICLHCSDVLMLAPGDSYNNKNNNNDSMSCNYSGNKVPMKDQRVQLR